MRATIGSKLIATLQPRNKQYDVRDTKLTGFLIRVNPSGKMFYVCQYGRGKRINIGRVGVITPVQARDKAIAILGDVSRGLDPTSKKGTYTLKAFIANEYLPWAREHRKTGATTVSHIQRCFVSLFGDKKMEDLTPALLDNWRTQQLKNGTSTETVNRYIAILKSALSKAVLWGFIENHPLAKLKLLKIDRTGKIRYLSIQEEIDLREALRLRDEQIKNDRTKGNEWRKERSYDLYPDLSNHRFGDHLHPMILLSINTGLRQGELFSLTWENVCFIQSIVTIEGSYSKSGKTRHIPLNSEAKQALMKWKQQHTSGKYVFANHLGMRFNNVKKAWSTILKKAKIENFRWHDMRHHFASKLVMAGVDLNTVRELLGHSDMVMTLRYAHLAPEHKARAVEKLIRNNLPIYDDTTF